MKKQILNAAKKTLNSGLFRPVGDYLSGSGTCLVYHRVQPENEIRNGSGGFMPNAYLTVSIDEFDRQLEYLSKNYRCLDVPQGMSLLKKGRLPERCIMLTFDDGYRDNLQHALPILKKYGVPAAIYLTTSLIDCDSVPWWYELEAIVRESDRIKFKHAGEEFDLDLSDVTLKNKGFGRIGDFLKKQSPDVQKSVMAKLRGNKSWPSPDCHFLSWKDVETLSKEPLITLGAHTQNHFVLSKLSEDELRREFTESKKILEDRLGRPVIHLAYPFGGIDDAGEREFKVAEELGFESAFTTRSGHLHPGHSKTMLGLPRIFVSYYDTLENLKWKLSGFSASLYQLRDRIHRGIRV